MPLHPLIPHVQLLRRTGKKDEHVVVNDGLVAFRGGRRLVARRLQADPPEPVARRERLFREMLDEVERTERVGRLWFHLSYHLCPATRHGRSDGPFFHCTGQGACAAAYPSR